MSFLCCPLEKSVKNESDIVSTEIFIVVTANGYGLPKAEWISKTYGGCNKDIIF